MGTGVLAEESQLKDVFVTAARTEQSLDAVNASVQTISAEQFKTFSGRSLTEVLQYATGALVKDSGSSSSFALRGQDADKTLILVDGLRRTEKYAGSNLNNIQLEDVERIEIVRGPMSALYGSDALGGVVNIITRAPRNAVGGGVRFMVGQTEDHQRDTFIVGGHGNWGDEQIAHRLSFEAKRRDSYRKPESDPRITDLNNEDRNFFAYRGDLKTEVGRFNWNVEAARQDDDGVGIGRTGATYEKIEQEDRDFVQAGYRGQIGPGDLTVNAGYGKSDASVNRGTVANETTLFKQTQFDGQYAFALGKEHAVVAGYAYRQDDLDISTNSGRVERDTNALFVQDSWFFLPDTDLTLGVRRDDYSDFGGKTTPRLALAWRPGPWTFRGGVGQGFKAPSLLNLHMTSIIRGRYDLRGNPDLKPEESTSAELATAYQFGRGQLEVVAHHTEVKGLIVSVPTGERGPGCGATPTPATSCQIQEYRNVGEATISGAELSGRYQLTDAWQTQGSLEYLDARDDATDARLTDRPRWAAKLALQWHSGNWQADFRVRHTRDWYGTDPAVISSTPFNSSYTVGSMRLAYAFKRFGEIFGGVDNVADTTVPVNQTSRGTPDDPGARYYYLGYAARF